MLGEVLYLEILGRVPVFVDQDEPLIGELAEEIADFDRVRREDLELDLFRRVD